jgi:hypothetical protein
MTEAEWLASREPHDLLEHLRDHISDRRLRLFSCACIRRIRRLLTAPGSWESASVVERFTEGEATSAELRTAELALNELSDLRGEETAPYWVPFWAADQDARKAVYGVIRWMVHPHVGTASWRGWLADVLRDILGNPFRPVVVDPAWVRWHEGLVRSMARRMYDENDFGDMAVLADALEEAGCQDSHILAHCRGPGEHVRGCHLLDALLGNE